VFGNFRHRKLFARLGISFLVLMSVISLAQGVKNAVRYSQDFQWSPSRLLTQGTNPYEYYLDGNRDGKIILDQEPNYLHALYVVLYPLARMDWTSAKIAWASINVLLAFAVLIIVLGRSKLSTERVMLVSTAFLCSTPLRNSIGNGQQAVLVLFCASLILLPSRSSAVFFGFNYVKYSFLPPFAAYCFLKRGTVYFLLSGLMATIGFLAFYSMQGTHNLVTLALQPIRVSALAVGLGTADWMSLVQSVLGEAHAALLLYYAVPMVASLAAAYYYARKAGDPLLELAAISIVSLAMFKHISYDLVFLLPALALFMVYTDPAASIVGIIGVAYFWFGLKLLDIVQAVLHLGPWFPDAIRFTNFGVLCLLLALIDVIRRRGAEMPFQARQQVVSPSACEDLGAACDAI
jgi:hypothetical protein